MTSPTKHLLACHDCGLLQPLISDASGWTEEALADARGACDEFADDHRTHCTAWFHRLGSETGSDGPLWDPMASIAFEVTDGHDTYVAWSTRQSIEDPRRYRFAPGTLKVQCREAVIDDRDFRRGLDAAFHPHALRPSKVDRLMAVLHELVGQIPPEALEVAFDIADDPALSIARMPDQTYVALLSRCDDIFDPWESSRLQDFLHENRDTDGLLGLVVRHTPDVLTA